MSSLKLGSQKNSNVPHHRELSIDIINFLSYNVVMSSLITWPETIREIYPDGDYAQIPDLARSLSERSVANIWVPYSPKALDTLRDSGLIQWAVYSGADLTRVNSTFEQEVLETVRDGEMAAIVTHGLNPPESRQFWLLGSGD